MYLNFSGWYVLVCGVFGGIGCVIVVELVEFGVSVIVLVCLVDIL